MTTAIGVVMTEHIVTGRLEDHKITGKPLRYPADPEAQEALGSMAPSELVETIAGQIDEMMHALPGSASGPVNAIGVSVPGIVRSGVVEESPNLPQIKGMRLAADLAKSLAGRGIKAPVSAGNDADAIAAGVAATRGRLD